MYPQGCGGSSPFFGTNFDLARRYPRVLDYLQRHKQPRIFKLFGKIDYDPNYNYKRERRRKRG